MATKTKTRKPTTKKPAAKTTTAVDRFGTRKGTLRARLNAAVTRKPKTMQQLMTAAKTEQTQYNHLNVMIAAGHVVRDEDGRYSLK